MAKGKGSAELAAQVEHRKIDLEMLKVQRSMYRSEQIVRGLTWVACILASAVPLWMLRGIVEPLAGKKTVLDVNIVVSITLVCSLALNGYQFFKSRQKTGEFDRMRSRTQDLETRLGLPSEGQRITRGRSSR